MNGKRVILAVVLTAMLGGPVFAGTRKENALNLFVQAGMLYQKEDYTAAVMKYEQILRAGVEGGNIYFNLGNCYFKMGRLGKAVLNYERAQRFIPRDSDLKFNLRYARNQAGVAEPAAEGWAAQMLEGHLEFYSLDDMLKVVVALVWLMAGWHLAGLYGRWRPGLRHGVFGMFAALLVVFCVGIGAKIGRQRGAAVVIADTQATFEPREGATVHFPAREGLTVKLGTVDGTWVKVSRSDKKEGWVPLIMVEKI